MFDRKTLSENLIFEFIPLWKGAAHFKNAKTTEYIDCNQHLVKSFGVQDIKQVIGRTVKDIEQGGMLSYWGSGYAAKIDHFDYLVINEQRIIDHNEIITTYNRRIKLHNLIKFPVVGIDNKKVSGIFTYATDLTHTFSKEELYKQYRCHYKRDEAIAIFLGHIGVDKYFVERPTNAEVRLLLDKAVYDNYKAIANRQNCKVKTLENLMANLKEKVVNGDVSQILIHIRTTSL